MENKTKETEFGEELQKLCEKHGVTNFLYAGTMEGHFIGASIAPKKNALEVVMNAARLYQYTRENCRNVMERIDKDIKQL